MTETIVPVTTTRTGMDELAQRELAVQMAGGPARPASTWSGRAGY